MKLGAPDGLADIEIVSTGSLALDVALGVGGFPRGRVVEIYGPETSGKTTLALHVIAESQKQGGTAPSSTPSMPWTRCMQRSWASMSMSSHLAARHGGAGTRDRRHAGALRRRRHHRHGLRRRPRARAEIEGEMGDTHVGLQARLMSQALRKLTARYQIQMPAHLHQPDPHEDRRDVRQPRNNHRRPRSKFYASLRLDVRTSASRTKMTRLGNKIRVKVVKNKVAPPFEWPRSTSCTARASPDRRPGGTGRQ